MLNIEDSSIKKRCWAEEYQCTPTNPDFNSENRSSGLEEFLETGQPKITAIADNELHNLILNWRGEPIILV